MQHRDTPIIILTIIIIIIVTTPAEREEEKEREIGKEMKKCNYRSPHVIIMVIKNRHVTVRVYMLENTYIVLFNNS